MFMAQEHSNSETKTAQAMTPIAAQNLSFIKGADSVYPSAAMTPNAFSMELVNAPQQGAELYDYGTEQS